MGSNAAGPLSWPGSAEREHVPRWGLVGEQVQLSSLPLEWGLMDGEMGRGSGGHGPLSSWPSLTWSGGCFSRGLLLV